MKENINLLEIETVIDKNIGLFLQRVKDLSEIGPYEKSRKDTPGFPILKPANTEYYKYKYFEKTLECYIREHLANAVFAELFELNGIESTWPSSEHIYSRFSNEAIEDIYPFEFIVRHNGKNIGYRFTMLNMKDSQLKALFKDYHLDYIKTIEWSHTDSPKLKSMQWGISAKYRTQVMNITLENFFGEYFSDEVFSIYISKTMAAVEKANYEIGFQTVPQLSPRYLSKFKAEVLLYLIETDFESMNYQMKSENGALKGKSIPIEDYIVTDANFKTGGLYRTMTSDEDYAKCFITSEYLYQVFKSGSNFDYTSVVSGYLKCIEQLMYKIMKITLDFNNTDELWIKAKKFKKDNPNFRRNPAEKWNNVSQVVFKSNYERDFDIALTPLIWFLHDNNNSWYISEKGKGIVHSYLLDYSKECRNEHFHKDNIFDFNVVKLIRNNTLFLIYLLIGGCVLTGSKEQDYKRLGIIDDSYDRLYKKLNEIPLSTRNFYLEFGNGIEIKAVRLHFQNKPIYNDNGYIQSEICFAKVDDLNIENDEKILVNISAENVIKVSRANLPRKVWFVKYSGERAIVLW